MTLATQITVLRILLTPVFVALAIYYARSVAEAAPQEWMRIAATIVFSVAALSDAVDGWIARRFAQESHLGRILDPFADKLLIVSAVLTLSLSSWPAPLPLWFVILVVTREFLALAGTFAVDYVTGRVRIEPHWTGKLATVLLLATIGAAVLRLAPVVLWLAVAASVFALVSGGFYLADGARQVKAAGGDAPAAGG